MRTTGQQLIEIIATNRVEIDRIAAARTKRTRPHDVDAVVAAIDPGWTQNHAYHGLTMLLERAGDVCGAKPPAQTLDFDELTPQMLTNLARWNAVDVIRTVIQ